MTDEIMGSIELPGTIQSPDGGVRRFAIRAAVVRRGGKYFAWHQGPGHAHEESSVDTAEEAWAAVDRWLEQWGAKR